MSGYLTNLLTRRSLAAILFALATVAISAVLPAAANADPALNGAVVAFGSNFDGQTVVPVLRVGVTYTAVAGGGAHSLALRSAAPAPPAPALAVSGVDSTAALAVGVIILLLGAALATTTARRQRT